MSSSSWAPAVTDGEHLMIDHVGHHGDGVAIAGGGNIYVPYTLGGETVEVASVPGRHPDRRRLVPHLLGSAACAHDDARCECQALKRETHEELLRSYDGVPAIIGRNAGPGAGFPGRPSPVVN